MRTKTVLIMCLFLAIAAKPLIAGEKRYSIGAGYADLEVDLADGDTLDADGGFGLFRIADENGSFLLFSLSLTEGDDEGTFDIGGGPMPVTVDDEYTRLAISGGFLFRRDKTVRPFVHAGFSWVQVEETVSGFPIPLGVDDSSLALIAGAGVEVGRGNHAFYADIVYDYNHDVEFDIQGLPSSPLEFDLLELHVGYTYTF